MNLDLLEKRRLEAGARSAVVNRDPVQGKEAVEGVVAENPLSLLGGPTLLLGQAGVYLSPAADVGALGRARAANLHDPAGPLGSRRAAARGLCLRGCRYEDERQERGDRDP